MKIQYEEAEFLYEKNSSLIDGYDSNTSKFEIEFNRQLDNMELSDEEKQLAMLKWLRKNHERKEEKN